MYDVGSPDGGRALAQGQRRGCRGHAGCIPVFAMNGAEREITAPIKLDELRRLLNAMTPLPPTTARARRTDLDVARARGDATRSGPSSTRGGEPSRPKRIYPRPFSQVVAPLPRGESTRPSSSTPARPHSRSLAVPAHKGPRTVAELRARLDSGETAAVWAASCVLSPRVLAHLRSEELERLPEQLRGDPPRVPDEGTPPPTEVRSVPRAEVIHSQSARGIAPVPAPHAPSQRLAITIASLATVILVAICVAYLLA
jgi:hypothetical protein